MQETRVQFLGWKDPLEGDMPTHTSILAWEIPWTVEPGQLQSMGLQRVKRDWASKQHEKQSQSGRIWTSNSSLIRCGQTDNVSHSAMSVCDPMGCSSWGSSVHGILQARILEWVAIAFSRGSSQPRDWTQVSCITSRFFTIWQMT